MPSPSWLTPPSTATSRAASGPARREDAERGRAHRQAVAPGVPVLGGDRGGQAAPQVLQGAALAEPGAPERPLVEVGDPPVPGRLHPGGGQPRAVPGEEQPGEDRVLGVVGPGRVLGDVSGDAAPAAADLGGLQVLCRGAQRVADGQAEQGAPAPLAQGGGEREGRAGRCHHRGPLWDGPRGPGTGPAGIAGFVACQGRPPRPGSSPGGRAWRRVLGDVCHAGRTPAAHGACFSLLRHLPGVRTAARRQVAGWSPCVRKRR